MSAQPGMDEGRLSRLAQASGWRVRLTEAGVEAAPAFEAWLAQDAANSEAWAQVQAPWIAVGDAATSPELIAARRDALRRAHRRGRRRWLSMGGAPTRVAAGLIAVAASAIVYVAVSGGLPTDYHTALGERRVVTLMDGSRVSLDSGSDVSVLYGLGARRLTLNRGQARFDVAHDLSRPFSVRAGGETVIATGTAFDIDLMAETVMVTLIQGRVTVAAGSGGASSVVLSPGQQLVADPGGRFRVGLVRLERVNAWETGQLIFDDEALGSVVQRINRYTENPILVDPAIASLKISGVFTAGDVTTFIDTISHYLPVEASEAPDGTLTLRKKAV